MSRLKFLFIIIIFYVLKDLAQLCCGTRGLKLCLNIYEGLDGV